MITNTYQKGGCHKNVFGLQWNIICNFKSKDKAIEFHIKIVNLCAQYKALITNLDDLDKGDGK